MGRASQQREIIEAHEDATWGVGAHTRMRQISTNASLLIKRGEQAACDWQRNSRARVETERVFNSDRGSDRWFMQHSKGGLAGIKVREFGPLKADDEVWFFTELGDGVMLFESARTCFNGIRVQASRAKCTQHVKRHQQQGQKRVFEEGLT